MAASELRLLLTLVLLAACDSTPEEPAPARQQQALADRPVVVLEDPAAHEPGLGPTRTLPDDDQPPPSAKAKPARPELRLASGAVLVLADPAHTRRRRAALEDEFGPRSVVSPDELEQLRMQWFLRGTGIVVQNPSERSFRLVVNFSSSVDPQCSETVVRTRIEGESSSAPAPTGDCPFDTATATLFDEYGIEIGTVTLHPEDV